MTRHLLSISFITGLLLAALSLSGCNGFIVRIPDKIETRQYELSDFSAVDIGDAFSFEITRADSYIVNITANANLLDYIDVSKTGQTLKINVRPLFHLRKAGPLKAVITMPYLNGLTSSGAAEGSVSGFKSTGNINLNLSGASEVVMTNISVGDTDCTLSGASELKLISFNTNNAYFNLSGASNIEGDLTSTVTDIIATGASSVRFNGMADGIIIDASGASEVALSDFQVHTADINLSGASECHVNADNRLDVNLSGGSKLVYYGNPSIKGMEITGGSEIIKK